GVMRDHLRGRPVKRASVRRAQRLALPPAFRSRERRLTRISNAPKAWSASSLRYSSGGGSPAALTAAGARNPSSAAKGVIHAERLVAKSLPRNGPSGWYSQD